MQGPLYFPGIMGKTVLEMFLTSALGEVMLKIEALQNTHIFKGDICKICTPPLSTDG
jgi:hypothetical protein